MSQLLQLARDADSPGSSLPITEAMARYSCVAYILLNKDTQLIPFCIGLSVRLSSCTSITFRYQRLRSFCVKRTGMVMEDV
jgi:hypothetical protein